MPNLDLEAKQKLKYNLLKSVAALPDGQMFHDDTLAKIFNESKKRTYLSLSGPSKEKFRSDIQRAQKPAFVSQTKLAGIMSGDEKQMTSAEVRAAAAGGTKTFISPQRKDAVIVAGRTHESGQTRPFKMGILDDPKVQGPLNHRKIPISLRDKMMRLAHMRSGRRYADGGMVYMANGGMVPNVQYLNKGSKEPARNSAGMGGMGFMMGGMGLQMAGQSVGGTAGSLMSSAGLAMNFMPMLGMLPKIAAGTNVVTGAFKGLTGMIGRATAAAKMFALSNPYLLAATVALAGIIALIRKMRKDSEDTKKEQIALFGVSEKGAKELGIQYVSLTDKLKAVREEQKLAADKAKAYFESYTGSGVRGLTLTIQQLRELKERVKADMPETLGILNSIDSSKINDWAANLKAQMISSGKSVEDATNLIYALIESSNKAGMGIAGITSKIFNAIQGQSSAASFITKNLAENFDKVSEIKGEAFASNLDTAVSSVENAIQALVGTKNAQGDVIDQAEALSTVYKEIATSGNGNKKVTQDVLNVIQKQRPELAAILNQSDTIGSG
jgi:hypothetical protein